MTAPLLATKLFIPSPHARLLARPALLQKLQEGLYQGRHLTLVCAPAGYGKSMLVAEWLSSTARQSAARVSWLSLDENDNEPARFLSYLAATIRQAEPGLGESLQSMLGGPQLPHIEDLMTNLINDLAAADQDARSGDGNAPGIVEPLVLALDDYHKIHLPVIHEALQFLLDHCPPRFHIVLLTREDPPLQTGRMRARREMTEVRAQDLRFSLEESMLFFNQVMKLDLAPRSVRALEERTEGWVAGLQLVALSLQGRSDIDNFVEDFHGSHRYVIEYLMDEVLRVQGEDVRRFLCETSILERLCAPLCEAVTGRGDCAQMLERIEQSNLFLIALDERREWYRYHHLFGDLLRTGLTNEQQALLRRRASAWLEQNGHMSEAIQQSLAAHDHVSAARQVGTAATELIGKGELATVLAWLRALPEDVVRADANLLSLQAFCLYFTGHIPECIAAMQALDGLASTAMDRLSRGRLACLRSWFENARLQGRAVELADEALALIGDSDPLFHAVTFIPKGHGHRNRGELQLAAQAYQAAVESARRAGHFITMVSAANSLATVLNSQARREQAVALCQEVMQVLVDRRGRPLPVGELIGVSWSMLAYEANELPQAIDWARKGRAASERFLSNSVMGGEGERILIRSLVALADTEAADEILQEVRQEANHLEWVKPQLEALTAELALRRGDVDFVAAWAESAGLSIHDESLQPRQYAYYPYVRLLLAQHRPQDAKLMLDRLEALARKEGRDVLLITIDLLRCRAALALGEPAHALQHLQDAVARAMPGRYLRRFLDEGPEIERLIRELLSVPGGAPLPQSQEDAFLSELLRLFPHDRSWCPRETPAPQNGGQVSVESRQSAAQKLIEPLSEQELKVLRLLSAGLSNQDIAAELVIGVGTVKWHVHNIYNKLGVGSRTQAAARAQELKLT